MIQAMYTNEIDLVGGGWNCACINAMGIIFFHITVGGLTIAEGGNQCHNRCINTIGVVGATHWQITYEDGVIVANGNC